MALAMERGRSRRARTDDPVTQLAYIRDTVQRAGSFTAVSGTGQMLVGGIGLLAAVAASRARSDRTWIAVWLAAAAVAVSVNAVAIVRKARRLHVPLWAPPTRRFVLTFATPLATGAVLTWVNATRASVDLLPGMWLLLFGTAVTTGGAMSVPAVPVMGAAFMSAGVVSFLVPGLPRDVVMGVGFGVLNVVFGAYIAVKHGG